MSARLTRRGLLGAALAAPAFVRAATGFALRVGAVLPLGGSSRPDGSDNLEAVAEIARQGVIFGEEEMNRNGALFRNVVRLSLAAQALGVAQLERARPQVVDRALAGAAGLLRHEALDQRRRARPDRKGFDGRAPPRGA